MAAGSRFNCLRACRRSKEHFACHSRAFPGNGAGGSRKAQGVEPERVRAMRGGREELTSGATLNGRDWARLSAVVKVIDESVAFINHLRALRAWLSSIVVPTVESRDARHSLLLVESGAVFSRSARRVVT